MEFVLSTVPDAFSKLQPLVAEAASLIRVLHYNHSIAVTVIWRSRDRITPSADALRVLSPLLSQVDHFDIAKPYPKVLFTIPLEAQPQMFFAQHLEALQQGRRRITALSVWHIAYGPTRRARLSGAMTAIGSLTRLTKLHFHALEGGAIYEPLARLGCLQDLALCSWGSESSCEGVLSSSKKTLSCLRLEGDSWSAATYSCIAQLPNIASLTVIVRDLDEPQAQEMAQIKAVSAQLVLWISWRRLAARQAALNIAELGFHKVLFPYQCRFSLLHDLCRVPVGYIAVMGIIDLLKAFARNPRFWTWE